MFFRRSRNHPAAVSSLDAQNRCRPGRLARVTRRETRRVPSLYDPIHQLGPRLLAKRYHDLGIHILLSHAGLFWFKSGWSNSRLAARLRSSDSIGASSFSRSKPGQWPLGFNRSFAHHSSDSAFSQQTAYTANGKINATQHDHSR